MDETSDIIEVSNSEVNIVINEEYEPLNRHNCFVRFILKCFCISLETEDN